MPSGMYIWLVVHTLVAMATPIAMAIEEECHIFNWLLPKIVSSSYTNFLTQTFSPFNVSLVQSVVLDKFLPHFPQFSKSLPFLQ